MPDPTVTDDAVRGHIEGWDWNLDDTFVTLHITVPSTRLGKFDDKKPVILSQITEKESGPMPDQTPVTNDDRRKLHEDAQIILHTADSRRTAVRLAEYVVANVPAPPATVPEALRELAAKNLDYTEDQMFDILESIADRAEAVEKENRDMERELHRAWAERDEARAEVERLTSERTSKESLPVALPDPADVPRGEPWTVVYNHRTVIGVRTGGYPTCPWRIIYEDNSYLVPVSDEEITLVSRLVPDTRRVIDRPEELDVIPDWTVVLDQDGEAWQINPSGYWVCRTLVKTAEELIDRRGPVTVIYVPEVTA